MCAGSVTQTEPARSDMRVSSSISSYQERTQARASSAPAQADECRHSRSLDLLPCRQIANSAMLVVGPESGQSTACARMAAERRSTPRTRSGDIRARRASKWSSMLHFVEIGPTFICCRRDFFTDVVAAGSDCGKCSVPTRAIARLELGRHETYVGQNIGIKVKQNSLDNWSLTH